MPTVTISRLPTKTLNERRQELLSGWPIGVDDRNLVNILTFRGSIDILMMSQVAYMS